MAPLASEVYFSPDEVVALMIGLGFLPLDINVLYGKIVDF